MGAGAASISSGESDECVEIVDEHAGLDQPADARGEACQPAAELLHRERRRERRRDRHLTVAEEHDQRDQTDGGPDHAAAAAEQSDLEAGTQEDPQAPKPLSGECVVALPEERA